MLNLLAGSRNAVWKKTCLFDKSHIWIVNIAFRFKLVAFRCSVPDYEVDFKVHFNKISYQMNKLNKTGPEIEHPKIAPKIITQRHEVFSADRMLYRIHKF
jgi:hypothetical protein